MDKIREYLKRPLIAGIAGLVVGLIIGLPILGWGLWPVQWYDAAPSDLRGDLKVQYLCMVVDSALRNPDAKDLAVARLDAMGIKQADIASTFKEIKPSDCNFKEVDSIAKFESLVLNVTPTESVEKPPSPLATQETTEAAAAPAEDEEEGSSSPIVLLVFLCVGLLIVGGVLVYLFVLRPRNAIGGDAAASPVSEAQTISRSTERTDFSAQGQETPLAQFMTTYMQGDDLYDDSFSIETPSGEFLGECGVGISETIGVGEPKKVTAFEVWLFDKNDIQTITKVLMSSYAYNDEPTRQRLSSKGEPVLVEPGKQVLLETATLQLEARVVESVYGQGALPAGSFMKQLTLELAIWPKNS